jgi:hypothetical protein
MSTKYLFICLIFILPLTAAAQGPGPVAPDRSQALRSSEEKWWQTIEVRWGGQVKARGLTAFPDPDSIYGFDGTDPDFDAGGEFRLLNTLFFGDNIRFDTHYVNVISGGDTRRKANQLRAQFPDAIPAGAIIDPVPNDALRALNLSSVIDESDSFVWYQRLDRLFLTVKPGWGVVRVGRQAITWGNGLIFNPMDLFNPFPPTDVERDYKLGDDMVVTQLPAGDIGNLEALYVARRDPQNGDIAWSQASVAGNIRLFPGLYEFNLMGAKHFDDIIAGAGAVGFLGGAAWRVDATWTFLDEDSPSDDYLSLVANIDMSWVWKDKNVYGLCEFYWNGLGESNYISALTNPDIVKRLATGELFVLGRPYLSGSLQVELHPLFNVFFTAINNISDPSGIVQPYATYDFAPDFQLLFGANLFYGAKGTEYGGIVIPGSDLTLRAADSVYARIGYYF